MKRITPAILAAFSVFALSFSITSSADNTDNDGFIVFDAQEATENAAPAENKEATVTDQSAKTEVAEPAKAKTAAKKPKAKKKAVKRAKRAKRAVRKKRVTRKTRTQRRSTVKKASTYRVRKGDTLYRISKKFGVNLDRLARLNKLHGSKKHAINAGRILRLR